MKTIGVIGGLGPQATMDFEARVHRVAQQLIPQQSNTGYPPMVVYYFRQAPVDVPAGAQMPTGNDLPVQLPPLHPDLLEAARRLGSMADFLVITSNGFHNWQPQIEQASGRKVVSMVDAALAEVVRRQWKYVGIVDFRPPQFGAYTRGLDRLGIRWEALPEHMLKALNVSVHAVDEGRMDNGISVPAQEAVGFIRARGVDGMILACTEIPLMIPHMLDDIDILNPIQYLAEAAVRFALS